MEKPTIKTFAIEDAEGITDILDNHAAMYEAIFPFLIYASLNIDEFERENSYTAIQFLDRHNDVVGSVAIEYFDIIEIIEKCMEYYIKHEEYELCAELRNALENFRNKIN